MTELRITLHGTNRLPVRVREDLIWIIKRAYDPLVMEAGQTLRMMLGPSLGDLNLTFDSTTPANKPCKFNWFGEDGGEVVYVQVHKSWRVCGPERQGHPDHRLFMSTDRRLARALANTAIHELGHFIADLDHSSDSHNYMITGEDPKKDRTRMSQRDFFAGHKSFTTDQKTKLVAQIRKHEWLGDFQEN